jgi:hypothetical protein
VEELWTVTKMIFSENIDSASFQTYNLPSQTAAIFENRVQQIKKTNKNKQSWNTYEMISSIHLVCRL